MIIPTLKLVFSVEQGEVWDLKSFEKPGKLRTGRSSGSRIAIDTRYPRATCIPI